jgi:ABC-2 type transport system ATP-binding protein
MIQIQNLSKKYKNVEVLNVHELSIKAGESFGLVGNNGAGKTTLFRIILDLIRPTSGTVTINHIEVQKSEEWKRITGSYLDENFLIDYLTPEEYFLILLESFLDTPMRMFNFIYPASKLFSTGRF